MHFSLPILFIIILFSYTLFWPVLTSFHKKIIFIAIFAITPWFWMLVFGEPPIPHLIGVNTEDSLILENFELILSFQRLFFSSEPTIFYIVGEYGYFMPTFILVIFLGIYELLLLENRTSKRIFFIFFLAIILSVVLSKIIGLFSGFIYLPFISLFAAYGFYRLYTLLTTKNKIFLKILILLYFCLIFYDSTRLFRIIITQYLSL